MKKNNSFSRNILSTVIGKVAIIIILAITGAIIDVQLLKADVTSVKNEVSTMRNDGTVNRKLLCKLSIKQDSLTDDERIEMCLDVIR